MKGAFQPNGSVASRLANHHSEYGLKRISSFFKFNVVSGHLVFAHYEAWLQWAPGRLMQVKDSSDMICLFGCIGSDLENITWLYFWTLSFQIRPIPVPNLISPVPEIVFPPTPPPNHRSIVQIQIYLWFSAWFTGSSLASDSFLTNRTCILGFARVCTLSSYHINSHLAALTSRVPRLCPIWLCWWDLTARIKWALRSMVKIHWIEKINNNKVAGRVKPDLVQASKATFFWGETEKWKYDRVPKVVVPEFLIGGSRDRNQFRREG